MSAYRRCFIPGGCYFFTVVTHNRKPLFDSAANVELLRQAMREVKAQRPFEIQGMVVLPDHLHALWRLPSRDADFSRRWRDIKHHVSKRIDAPVIHRNEKAVWQRRFWEHAIRNEDDWRRHIDYLHYNPVKHGFVAAASDWPYSSFRAALKKGWYSPDWGRSMPDDIRGWWLE
jgi:putative transposase